MRFCRFPQNADFRNQRKRLETITCRGRSRFTDWKVICGLLSQKEGTMLGFLFGFNARLGRLHYFLSTIALAVVMTAVCFAIASYAIQNTPRGTDPSVGLIAWPVIVSILVFLWITCPLQSMRIRDIGWDPVCVIPAWIAGLILGNLVADKLPACSWSPEHQGTILGALINFG